MNDVAGIPLGVLIYGLVLSGFALGLLGVANEYKTHHVNSKYKLILVLIGLVSIESLLFGLASLRLIAEHGGEVSFVAQGTLVRMCTEVILFYVVVKALR